MADAQEQTFSADITDLGEARSRLRSDTLLSGGGGDGTSTAMERLAKLEVLMEVAGKRLDRFEEKLGTIGDRLTRLEEKVAHLPSKGFIVTVTSITLALMVAAVTLQSKLQTMFGLIAH